MAKSFNRKKWDQTDDPIPMIDHLEDRGCMMDFTSLVDVFLIRIWREVSDVTLRQVLDDWFGTGATTVTQDEANAAAEKRVDELTQQLRDLDADSTEYLEVSRQIELGKALLVFDGSGFSETVIGVCQSMSAVASDPERERKWQADTIRGLFDFDYNPPDDE